MRLYFSYIMTIAFLMLSNELVLGQSTIEVHLTIDTTCLCKNSLAADVKGKLGIYAYIPIPKNSNNYVDTLIKELEIKKEQTINLKQGTYKIKFTPFDSLESTNQHYFILLSYSQTIDLNCFFFNKSYPSIIDQMSKKDTVILSSTYCGNTNDGTIITTHTVVIFKKRKKYYAAYYKSELSGPLASFPLISMQNSKYESQVLLSEEQVEKFRVFEENLLKMSINDNMNYEANARNRIWLNGKIISFYSKGYVALLLWDELNKTTAITK